MGFEINLIFLIKPFSYMTKKARQKFKYLKSEKSFKDEIKNFFHHLMSFHWSKLKTIFSEGESPALNYYITKWPNFAPSPFIRSY